MSSQLGQTYRLVSLLLLLGLHSVTLPLIWTLRLDYQGLTKACGIFVLSYMPAKHTKYKWCALSIKNISKGWQFGQIKIYGLDLKTKKYLLSQKKKIQTFKKNLEFLVQRFQIIEKVLPNNPHTLLEREKFWIQTLLTITPYGLNSHDLNSFTVLDICVIVAIFVITNYKTYSSQITSYKWRKNKGCFYEIFCFIQVFFCYRPNDQN